MLTNEDVEAILRLVPEIHFVKVEGDGYHYHVTVVSEAFTGKSRVARQQWIYSLLQQEITSGRLHALNMQTLTLDEWEKQRG